MSFEAAAVAAFLTARFDEAEQRATRSVAVWSPSLRTPSAPTPEEVAAGVDLNEPERKRALADIAAKRRVLNRHQPHATGDCLHCEMPHWGVLVCNHCYGKAWPCPDVLDLAAPHADHPELPEELMRVRID